MSTLATTNIKHPSSASNNIVLDSSGNVMLQAGSASTPALQPSGDTNTGIFFPAADTIAFAEGGVESVRIDSSSRLLVGTSTGISNYYIGGLDGWTASFQVARSEGQGLATFTNWSTQTSYGAEIFLAKSQSGTIGSHTVPSSGSVIGRINFNGSDGTNFRSAATISAEADGTFSNADSPGRLVFSTTSDGSSSPTERVRITNGGKVWLGFTSSPSSGTDTPGIELRAPNTTAGQWTLLMMASDNSTVALGYNNSGTLRSDITYNATTANAANVNIDSGGILRRSTSSIKYKRNIVDAAYGLSELIQLRPVTYQSKSDGDGNTTYGGLIAEEVDAAGLQEFVQYAEDGSPDALAYGNMVSLCIKAIQEQQVMIAELQAEVAALKAS